MIAKASGNLDKCTVVGMYFYVGNGTSILIYDLQTKTLFFSWNLGGSYSTTQIIKRSETWLYWKGLNAGVTELKCFKIETNGNLSLLDTVVPTSPSWTNWNSDLRNAAYIMNNSKKYWAWTDMLVTYTAKGEYSETITIYNTAGTGQRFYSCGSIYDNYGVSYGTIGTIRTYVLNVTSSTITNVQSTESYYTPYLFWGYQKVSVATVKEAGVVTHLYPFTADYVRQWVNIQNWINDTTKFYYSWQQYAVRDRTIISATLPASDFLATKYVYIDLPEKIYHISSLDVDGLRIQPATSAGGGAWTTINLSNNTNIATQIEGVMSAAKYQDELGSLSEYCGFISSTNYRPTVNKIAGGAAILVGQLPVATYTPTGARIYNGFRNIVAAFTIAGQTSLYVCRNMIPMAKLTNDYGPFAYLTYYYTTGGSFYVEWSPIVNGTEYGYVDGRTITFGALASSTYAYVSFNWTGSSTTDNPYDYTLDGNDTIWLYFVVSGGGGYAAGWADGNASGYSQGWIAGNSSGYSQGWAAGNGTGYTTGWVAGNATGWAAGNATGYAVGYNAGWADGYVAGFADGVASVVLPKYGPVSRWNATLQAVKDVSCLLNGSISLDPDGGNISNYSWDFDDGNVTSGNFPIVQHTWTVIGTYHTTLTVTDSDDGMTETFYFTIVAVSAAGTGGVNAFPIGLVMGFGFALPIGVGLSIMLLRRRRGGYGY